ncbi:cell division protein ZapA [Legionella beliardensis]|uniref:Cell division protein ZapA n=1 Tax=Legionella beliardensis TaxID=91822 RepID=A0A378HY92_9GAMM|nr:cell division protein ZapA [Legionella beliardensis]STX27521.1 cell division protein ZapA [Legionella beliardensis]
MTASKSCTIKLLNKNYDIKCPEHETANLQKAAAKLNEQLLQNKKKFKQLDDFQNLVLASLHISHELISCQKQQEQQRHQVTQFINSLENKINQVVNGNPFAEPQTEG